MQVSRDKFPGIDQALEGLPNLGQLFMKFFELYTRVSLRPWLPFKGMPFGRKEVALLVERYGSPVTIFPAQENGPRFWFQKGNDFRDEFKITAKHVDQGFAKVAEDFTIWARNQLSARLYTHEFHLALSNESSLALRDRHLALPMFVYGGWGICVRELGGIGFHLKGLQHTGIVLPGSDSYLVTTWDCILPKESEHHKLIKCIIYWYRQWEAAKKLSTDKHTHIDLDNMWSSYLNDMRAFGYLLKEE